MSEPPRAWLRFLAGWTGVPGVRLQPITLGQALLLRQFHLAVPPQETLGAGTLALYLVILSRPWRRAVKALHSRRGAWLVRWYGLWLVLPPRRLVSEVQVRRQITAALRGHEKWISERWSAGGDPILLLHRTLNEHLGFTPDCAASLPLHRALREVTDYLADSRTAGESRRAEKPQPA
jgi:hypothetical protein